MFRHRMSPATPLTRITRIIAAVVLVGWVSAANAQTSSDAIPPLPPAPDSTAQQNAAPASPSDSGQSTPQQAVLQQQQTNPERQPQQAVTGPATDSAGGLPPLPLGQDGVREVQTQLIALGFDPGPADGEAGPATLGAAQQYNENQGGYGPVPIDAALLARLRQDTGPRLTPEQVAARSQPPARVSSPSNPLANMMQQFQSNLRQLFTGGP